MQRRLTYNTTGTGIEYLNLAKDMAKINSKNFEVTTRDGHVFGYLVDIKASGSNISVYHAPNSWKMRNSFRKFHAYRDIMFDNAGVEGDELGRYGKTIRPLLDVAQKSDGSLDLVPGTENSVTGAYAIDGGDWSYTQLATTPIYTDEKPIVAEEKWADSFFLHICEENQVQGDSVESSGYYKSLGMIHSYNIDRQEVVTPGIDPATGLPISPGEVIDGPSNPLAALISSGNQATGEVLEIVQDQELELPPYDTADNGDSIETAFGGFALSTAQFPTGHVQCFAPAGLIRINADGVASLQVTVQEILLCKDMA